ncbi:cystatin-like [Rhinophrynus dorsalis]
MSTLGKISLVVILAMFAEVFANKENKPRLLGGWQDAKEDDKGVQRALQFATAQYNKESNGDHIASVHRIISARKQVVAGMKYEIEVEVFVNSCADQENCPNEENTISTKKRCSFQILSVPWKNITQLLKKICL